MKRDIDRLNVCFRCQKTNTQRIAMTDGEDDRSALVYSAWCFDCREHFSYRLRIETVWDRKNRI